MKLDLYLEPAQNGMYRVHSSVLIEMGIHHATALAAYLQAPVVFEFNGIIMTVDRDSDPKLLYRDYDRALIGCIDRHVGPYPKAVLTAEEIEHDAAIRAEVNEKRKAYAMECARPYLK